MHSIRPLLASATLLVCMACPLALSAQQPAVQGHFNRSYEKVLSQLEQQFVAVAQAMPGNQYDFTPATLGVSQADFKGVRTFAAEVKHVAEANYVMYEVMSGLKPDLDVNSIKNLSGKDEIVAALTKSFAFAHRALGTLTLSNAEEVPEDADGYTRAGLAAYAMVHDADHYGQLSEYLRMNGIIPPQSRK